MINVTGLRVGRKKRGARVNIRRGYLAEETENFDRVNGTGVGGENGIGHVGEGDEGGTESEGVELKENI